MCQRHADLEGGEFLLNKPKSYYFERGVSTLKKNVLFLYVKSVVNMVN